ncbi:class I SAM-dependent RNA methyltransferase [Benzoatithermus flavus]|uniref:TRAM domain-containing protein n=1 Tax=Benzoatithermus flavus TaxID=3108223 RepID=A0ABU8XUD4_9PROT
MSARHRPAPSGGPEREIVIAGLGAAGDGIADTPEGRIYLPRAVPGERWRVRLVERLAEGWRAEPVRCLEPCERAEPVCPHFGRCGGCRLQHLPPALYVAHKQRRIVEALARRGLPGEVVDKPRLTPSGSRRRLRLGLARERGRLILGFRARGSHRLEPVSACPIACPELAAALPALAVRLEEALATPLPEEVSLTFTEAGIDLLVHAARGPLPAERERLPQLAAALDLARVAWTAGESGAEPLVVRRQPWVRFGEVRVTLPPGAFLQATAFGEAALQAAVVEWSEGARRAVDLFAGVGTLTLALAPRLKNIRAVEGDAAAAEALRRAAGAARLGGVTVETRDLVRRPLGPAELEGCDLAVLDPPRAGALEQARALAASGVPKVVYVSCHPESFARDARILADAGFVLREVRPVDQFLFAAEIELAALLVRPGGAAQKRA